MPTPSPTVGELVARFELRRRASTTTFSAGVRLARQGAVRLVEVTGPVVQAEVRDPDRLLVELVASRTGIKGRCTCQADAGPCRHQVAVAHALWVQGRCRR